eukprot:6175814-Pleurochrysis_carterae.AAC.6
MLLCLNVLAPPCAQVIGGKKVGRPWRRHAANPNVSWQIIRQMNRTLPPAKWLYLTRDPYSQVCTCMIRRYCKQHGLDYYDDRAAWLRLSPLNVSADVLQLCLDDFELVAISAAELVRALPAARFGQVLNLRYEHLCDHTEETLLSICSFLGIQCGEKYVAAIRNFVHSPHQYWQYIRWTEEVPFDSIANLIRRLPAHLDLEHYLDLQRR